MHWRPWGPEALAEAENQNKPILLSIGYTACHWCHVMNEESFQDADTAALERELGAALGLRVTLAPKKRGGALTLHYESLDQLDRVLKLLRRG